jgi:prevent-host-death family protein
VTKDTIKKIPATEYQRSIGATQYEVTNHKIVVIVTAHGREQIAVLSAERYRELAEIEKKYQLDRANCFMPSVQESVADISNEDTVNNESKSTQ